MIEKLSDGESRLANGVGFVAATLVQIPVIGMLENQLAEVSKLTQDDSMYIPGLAATGAVGFFFIVVLMAQARFGNGMIKGLRN